MPRNIHYQQELSLTIRSLIIVTILAVSPSPLVLAGIDYQQKADELLPVDCLLPGAVRKLGGKMTYVTQRRPIKTNGVDCEIRGGEYVLYDRANYETALAIWQPLAESGDPRAQNFVGEIYEKGLGVAPNYEVAASWYEKAAMQNYNPAQVNLGQLYERGLGVEYNIEQALSWYRKSSNIKGKILKFVSFDYSDEKIVAMQKTIDENSTKTTKLNARIQTLVQKLDTANNDQATAKRQFEEQQRLLIAERESLKKQKDLLQNRQQNITKIRDDLKQQLLAQQQEQNKQVDKPKAGINITFPNIVIKFDKRKLASLKKKLTESEQSATELANNLAQKERALTKKELSLKKKDLKIAELAASYDEIQDQLASSQNQLPSSNTGDQRLAANTSPTIQMIEPPLLATRGDSVIKTRSGVNQRTIIGQVSSHNPLIEVLVNDRAVRIDAKGIFQHRIPLTRSQTKVHIVAIDAEGLRSKLDFKLEMESGEETNFYADNPKIQKKEKSRKQPKINFGNYHALIIGNSDYKSLPDLNTANADADAIADVLSKKYGFKINMLKDATRYDILSKLNELRGKLTDKDNLLVYYAGHGELDEVNNRGHWLPVDAESESSANWISNIAITDLLNAMSVRKVLVVADSCYSGAMTRSTLARLDAGRSEKAWASWLKMVADKRSRLSFSSGGLAPVLDGGGGKHSIFAKALLDVLDRNDTILEGKQIHSQVAQAVNYAAAAAQFDQEPQYAPIRFAGHESGDFLFVPKPGKE